MDIGGGGPARNDDPADDASSQRLSAPQYVADEFLRAEGFTDIRFVAAETSAEINDAVASNTIDFNSHFGSEFVAAIDAGAPITILSGVHVGCFQLFAREDIRAVTELKGRRIAIPGLKSSPHLFTSIILARVGLDPDKDIRWIPSTSPQPMALFADGKADAFLGLPPDAQEAQARRLGHVLVDSAADLPWSQYFCCMWAGNRDFVRAHPIATKRALRAILKADDLCTSNPVGVAKRLVEGGFTSARYEYALQALRDIPTTSGGSTTPRTRCASTPCGCTRSVWSNRPRRRSSPKAPTGVSSMN